MAIQAIYILPTVVIGRFGSSPTPMEAFSLGNSTSPAGFREIVPEETFVVDEHTGGIRESYVPKKITFRDGNAVRPVAPFVELFARLDDDELCPLTLAVLAENGLSPTDVTWNVSLANLKAHRFTGDAGDKILAEKVVVDHHLHPLDGVAQNFLPGKVISLGAVRYIQPTEAFPEIRLRFYPPKGLVYGSSLIRPDGTDDPIFAKNKERIVYDVTKGGWYLFKVDLGSASIPSPSDVYHGHLRDPQTRSYGYFDDVSDGFIYAEIKLPNGQILGARAILSSGMPDYAPDSQPIRTVADGLIQALYGPHVGPQEASTQAASELLQRSLDTIRLMNTVAMNGNTFHGRSNVAHSLVRQDSNGFGRHYAPIMAPSLVDPFAVQLLHQRIASALQAGVPAWFERVLRRPEEVGDLSDLGRRKMPAMLRGSDGRALTLTRRQINEVVVLSQSEHDKADKESGT